MSWCSFRLGRAGARELAADVLIDRQAKIESQIAKKKNGEYEETWKEDREIESIDGLCPRCEMMFNVFFN